MAKDSRNFSTWSSSSDANLCDAFNDCSSLRDCAMSTDLDPPAWLQVDQVTANHYPPRLPFQRPDMLASIASRFESGQVQKFQPAYNELPSNCFSNTPEVPRFATSVIAGSRISRSRAEAVFLELDHREEEVPARKIKTGRRRRVPDGTPDGWVASKNLISERKRREKLQKGLIALRELVPMFTKKMDKVSIIVDAISYLQELKQTVDRLESEILSDESQRSDEEAEEMANSSCNDLETSEADIDVDQRKNSSTEGSSNSQVSDEVRRWDYETSTSSRDWKSNEIQLDVTKMDHGLYKLDLICRPQSGLLVQISQAIESFVIEIVHTNIVVITSTKVTCSYIVKMSSWNDMTLEDVKTDTRKLLGNSGLQFSQSAVGEGSFYAT